MNRNHRLELIQKIENNRNSALISYIAGDRENISTRIAPDSIRVIYRHLENLKEYDKIDMFLYTRGGDVLTPWRLINLIREYTDEFNVIVPFRAYSAGTLICLGANTVIMGKMGELGPIDPVVANAFNPKDPNDPSTRIPISVEDVSSYFDLARGKGNLSDEESHIMTFSHLVENVHPLSLGNVHRNYLLIRTIARKLLRLSNEIKDKNKIDAVVDYLTKNLYAHNYMISRKEARDDIGLNIMEPDPELEELIWELYKVYEEDLSLREAFNPVLNMQEYGQYEFTVVGGIIESDSNLDYFEYKGQIDGKREGDVKISSQKWTQKI